LGNIGVLNRSHDFYAAEEVSRHPVTGRNIDKGSVVAVFETEDAGMFEEPSNNATNFDVVSKSGNSGPEAADAPDLKSDGNPSLTGPNEGADHGGIDEVVHFAENPGGSSPFAVGDFHLNLFE
jgi:hypothetical protein